MANIASPRPRILDLLVWSALAVPAVAWVATASAMAAEDLEDLLLPSGELSARFLIVALAITPLALLLPDNRFIKWLRRQRRAIGLAAFGYGVLHLIFYLVAMGTFDAVLAELGATGIWSGWLALALLVPLALTSSSAAMRALGRNWKRVQRLAYPAALLTLAHWLTIHDGFIVALAHFAPLVILELIRIPSAHPRRRHSLKDRQ